MGISRFVKRYQKYLRGEMSERESADMEEIVARIPQIRLLADAIEQAEVPDELVTFLNRRSRWTSSRWLPFQADRANMDKKAQGFVIPGSIRDGERTVRVEVEVTFDPVDRGAGDIEVTFAEPMSSGEQPVSLGFGGSPLSTNDRAASSSRSTPESSQDVHSDFPSVSASDPDNDKFQIPHDDEEEEDQSDVRFAIPVEGDSRQARGRIYDEVGLLLGGNAELLIQVARVEQSRD